MPKCTEWVIMIWDNLFISLKLFTNSKGIDKRIRLIKQEEYVNGQTGGIHNLILCRGQ